MQGKRLTTAHIWFMLCGRGRAARGRENGFERHQ